MKYMLFIKHTEAQRSLDIPAGLMDAMGTFVGEGLKSGTMIDTAGLKSSKDASTVTLHKGKLTVTDGPFAESKEIVGGYALINVNSRDEAMALATEFMELHRVHMPTFEVSCEVRPLEDM